MAATYAAFLRGINLGPNRRVSGADLRAAFEGMGLEDVGSFRASGNVVFGGASGSPAKLKARVEEGLEKATGMEILVFLRTDKEVNAIAAHEPFPPKQVQASKGKLQVLVLPKKPTAAARKEVLGLATDADRLAFGVQELYWLPSGGTLESTLDRARIEKLAGPTTSRTMGTMQELAKKFF
ncbi:MAG TPA: DUF1697 domain-containing protein [Thermoleophilaceae bacterium]|jgi:uncharacterized protein (DUF1697 family)